MSAIMHRAGSGSRPVGGTEEKMFKIGPVAIVWGILAAIYLGLRIYQQEFAFSVGLDSTAPEFATHWMMLLKIELIAIFGGGAIIWAYLWFTRDRNMDALTPREELRRHFGLAAWFLLYTFAFLWIASFFGEGDAVWHQTVVRDTSFTPSHIVVFYACVPMYIVFGVGSLLYATTRLPRFAKGYSVPLIMAVLGPGLILPNLGYNEWGHAFWLTEEIFSHPLHWGFPILGWTGFALGGVLLQVLTRMYELFRQIDGSPVSAAEIA